MIAELVNWLRRSLTSRRSLRRTVLQQKLGIWNPEVLSVPKSDKTGIAEGQLSLNIGYLVSACTTEADLSQKVQALSKSDKFAYLRQHSKPDPQFKFPKTFIGRFNRSFNHDWLDQHKLNSAFCMPCLLFNGMSDSTGKVSGAFVTKPFQTWQKKSAKFANHEKTSYHQCCLKLAEQLVHSVEHPETNRPALFNSRRADNIARNRGILKSVAIVLFCSVQRNALHCEEMLSSWIPQETLATS